MLKYLLPIVAIGLSLSCGSSRRVSMNVTRPAEITMPAEANTILLLDRTKPSNELLNTIEGLITGELPADDKVAAQEAMIRMKDRLNYSPRFQVKILPDRLTGNSLDGAFPKALDWGFINQLCIKNQAEIVVSLEIFDSDFLVTKGNRIKKKSVGEGTNKREVEYTEYYATGVGNVKMGIRTYYNKTQTIVDQQLFSEDNSWEGVGVTPMDALGALISKSNANKYLAGQIGESYAYKISPMPVSISRAFYGKSKKTPELETGSRFADVAQWNEAIDVWKKGLARAEKKDAGKLAYNIAIAYEVLGEYGTALTWAQDAYTKYGNKDGRDYVRKLRNRINEELLLKEQMKQ